MGQFEQDHDGSVRKWHAWRDKSGMPFAPMMWQKGTISTVNGSALCFCSSLEELISDVAYRGLFVLCEDLLSEDDFPFANDLIGHSSSHPYLSRSGGVVALRVSQRRHSGFLVPGATWGIRGTPTKESLQNIIEIFRLFEHQSSTPSSLSEKVLRSSLPDIINFSRPSLVLRRDILDNHRGGRIDEARRGQFFKEVFEYDKNKAYLCHSRLVPDPAVTPIYCSSPSLDRTLSYPTGYWRVHLRACRTAIAPIQINGRSPQEGEYVVYWLWTPELLDCIEAGYTVEHIERGYGWKAMSSFMEEWSDILWRGYERAQSMHPQVRTIIKSMMVGVPGRFLRQPVFHTLIPLSEARAKSSNYPGDIPLLLHLGPHWEEGDRIFTDYAMRPEYDRESAALSPIGSSIVMAMRHELYQMMKKEHENGRKVISSYIDCYRLDGPTTLKDHVGEGMGEWKEKRYGPSWTEENRFIGINLATKQIDVKAPGYDDGKRQSLLDQYQIMMS